MGRKLAAIGLVAFLVMPGIADDGATGGVVEWVNSIRGQEIGRESVTTRTEDGRLVIASEGQVAALGISKLEQRLVVDGETLAFIEYELRAETASGPQIVAARRTDDGVRFDVEARGQTMSQPGSAPEPVLCMDNLVLAHYTVLGRMTVARADDGPFSFTIAVPSVMKALPAELDPGNTVRVKIGEAVRTARHGKLKVASLLTNVWYDAENGSPYRVTVPAQGFEGRVAAWNGVLEEPPAESSEVAGSAPAFAETEVTFPSPLGDVPGTLTLPVAGAGGSGFPVVILLSGSGPNDRDETIGPNKPFRDIAHGLAADGIASLRYDKRTALVRQEIMDARETGMSTEQIDAMVERARAMTLNEEYLVDARAAIEFVAKQEELQRDAVFVLGHSLGGLAAPDVAANNAAVRGVILMAAAGRPFDALIESQIAFQATVAGMSTEAAAEHAHRRTAPLREILEQGDDEDAPDEFMNASAEYWRDVARRDAPAMAAALRQPVLLLQGAKDIQITVEDDFKALEEALARRGAVPYRSRVFADLNHLFIPVKGQSTGAEYFERGNVDPEVVSTIADWIEETLAGNAAAPTTSSDDGSE